MTLRAEKNTQIFKNLKKFVKIAIGCSSVATGGRGGGGGGVHRRSDGEGVGNSGMGAIGGGQQRGCRQPLRIARHNIRISLQNTLS